MELQPTYVGGAWIFAMELCSESKTEQAMELLDQAERNQRPILRDTTPPGDWFFRSCKIRHTWRNVSERHYELNNRHFEPISAYGYFLISEKRFEEAMEIAERGIELHPNNYHSFLMRGFLLSEKGELESALEDYRKSAQLNPTHFRPKLLEGLALFQNEKYEESIAPLESKPKI